MNNKVHTNKEVKQEILKKYGVCFLADFDVKRAVEERVDFLKSFLKSTGRKGYVLGISGGVDSSVVGRLCQLACEGLRSEGYEAKFIAMRLPAGVQGDEADAQRALLFVKPDVMHTVNVGEASNVMSALGVKAFEEGGQRLTASQIDFNKGNVKARMRMIAQYQMAAQYEALVIGTDHNAEAVMGFFTIWGDGACDVTVLGGVNKRQVRAMCKYLGAQESLWAKPPTADLEELKPGKLDDEGFGFAYEYLDDFLEGKEIPEEVEKKIVEQYARTEFKRRAIAGFK